MRIKVFQKGDFKKTEKFLQGARVFNIKSLLKRYGEAGVRALASATPKDTGETASSWGYEIQTDRTGARVIWTNSNIKNGIPIAIILQYGHGTGGGGYVQGRDYINPALRSIFDQLAAAAWKEVTSNGSRN